MFDIEISGQMAAWFLVRSPEKSMPHLKLIKLLYLTERTAIQQWGYPVLGDHLVSMHHGPVLSRTLNYMKKERPPYNGWTKWVSPVKNYKVSLAKDYEPEDLDLLSKATLDILAEVWYRFGRMDRKEIVVYVLQNCREWETPQCSYITITHERLLRILGHNEEKTTEIATRLEDRRKLSEIFSSIA